MGYIVHGVAESDMTERLTHTHTHTHTELRPKPTPNLNCTFSHIQSLIKEFITSH